MNTEERWNLLVNLDEDVLRGGVTLSEWCTFIVREADTAFANGAYLASILTAVSAIETYLRSEYSVTHSERLVQLIDVSSIGADLKNDLHALRKYRNRWVHLDDPWNDSKVLEQPEAMEMELEAMALFAVKLLRRTIYENQWV